MTQRNTPVRAAMLAARAEEQRTRTTGFTRVTGQKRGPKGPRPPIMETDSFRTHMEGAPADINRRTGQPHEHARERARRLKNAR